jgi:DNA-binding MarR family transcriptional regulator
MLDALLALRCRVSDETLLDCLDLAQLLQPPCVISTAKLREHWQCSQPTVSRRLGRLWDAGLISYRIAGGRGCYTIRSLGPSNLHP